MAETLTAFHARVDGYTHCSLNREEDLVTCASLADKVAPDGALLPFFGSTVVYDMDGETKEQLAARQALLYRHGAACLAEPLAAESFHITLHDLVSGTHQRAVEKEVARTQAQAQALLAELSREGIAPVRMVSTQMFSMVQTSVVQGFAPETEADCTALMRLYERFHAVVPLGWGLTPHVTLGYYRPGRYGMDTVDALAYAFAQASRLPQLHITLAPERLRVCRFSSMNCYHA